MSSTTRIRVFSAAIVVLLVLTLYYFFETRGLLAVVILVALGTQREYYRITLVKYPDLFLKISFHAAALLLFYLCSFYQYIGLAAFSVVFIFLASLGLVRLNEKDTNLSLQNYIASSAVGLIYTAVLPSFGCKILLREPLGLKIFILCLVSVFATDVFAYFVGKKFGKRKLIPLVSPNKTWEGAYGGFIAAGVIAFGTSYLLGLEEHRFAILVTALVGSVFGQLGDLFESLLKRNANVKDSGSIMPGHGGYLDRVDAVLFTLPIYYLLLQFIL